MIFATGTKVRLRFTGDTATVIAPLGGGMVQLRMDDDPTSLIPAFEEDLEAVTVMNKFAVAPKTAPAPPPLRVLKSKLSPEESRGIQLVFEPMPGKDDIITRYKTWILNDTTDAFLFELGIFIGDDRLMGLEGKLDSMTIYEVGDILSDDLNDSPEAELGIRRITTAGPDDELFKVTKIRPKHFYKNFDYVPILNITAHPIVIFDKFDPGSVSKEPSEDLKAYTKEKKAKPKPTNNSNSTRYELYNVEAFAHFQPEIDLHIHALMPGYARLDKGEILRIQMKHFESFMDRALRLGVPNVFVIHGVGEGKLKEAVAQRLKSMPFVRKFKNEYHHKYGYGATEVWFE